MQIFFLLHAIHRFLIIQSLHEEMNQFKNTLTNE